MLATVPCVRLFECWQLFKGIVANGMAIRIVGSFELAQTLIREQIKTK